MPRRKTPAPEPPTRPLNYRDPDMVRAMANLALVQREAESLYTTHPWPFIRDCVRTLDEIDGSVKRAPDKPYVEFMVTDWFDHKLVAVAKSRRMWMTWCFIACNYWLARFRENSRIAFAAREEGKTEDEGSNELVKRAWFIHSHLEPLLPECDATYVTGHLRFPNGSLIQSIPQGINKSRQYTFTSYFADEFAHWPWAQSTYDGLKPTIDGGGRVTLCSSAGPGFFERVVYDAVDRG